MLMRIDRWVADRLFQPIIDWSQRKPAWWGKQCAIAMGVLTILGIPLMDTPWWGVLLNLFAVALMYGLAQSDAAFAAGGTLGFMIALRWVMMTLLAIMVLGDAPLVLTVRSAVLLSYQYFGLCRPPKPREPRRSLAPSGASS